MMFSKMLDLFLGIFVKLISKIALCFLYQLSFLRYIWSNHHPFGMKTQKKEEDIPWKSKPHTHNPAILFKVLLIYRWGNK